MTRRLRIAVWHNLPSGGAKRALYDHVSGLVERGHDVEAWCPPTADQSYLPLSELIPEHVVALDRVDMPQLRDTTRSGPLSPIARNIHGLRRHSRAVSDAMGNDFDVVFAGTCQALAVPLVGECIETPSVLYLQEPNRVLYEAFFRRSNEAVGIPSLPWLGRRPVARAAMRMGRAAQVAIRAYDRILVNSRYSRESVLSAYGISAHVCYLGIDTDRFIPSPNPPQNYVVGVGAVVGEKNIELVIDALGRVDPTPPPLIWIANHAYGDGYIAELEQRAENLGVALSIRQRINDAELVTLVGGACAMVYAPRLEPFGFAPLEANACGIPVVAAAEGGVRETVVDGRNGLLVNPDAPSLAEGITRLWRNPDVAAALGKTSRDHVLRSWTLTAATDRLEQHLLAVAR